ncbi:unnamed protein product [Candida verbasci]|uniref:Uncharacterized protein n=1 Tax=Candida verbasci TaxID=1227364 RepID=A0A9W4X912_9ASCO|nr:unnamed protein product [Candida verbasci]
MSKLWNESVKYSNSQDFYKNKPGPSINQFPTDKTDIKGLPAEAIDFLYRYMKPNSMTSVLKNEYLMVKFIPSGNYLNRFKRSAIAIFFNMANIHELNDGKLSEAKSKYRGEYKYLDWFDTKLKPSQSAPGRNKIRRLYKTLFINALNEINQEKGKSIGIYQFIVYKYPVNSKECNIVQSDFVKMMKYIFKTTIHSKNVPTGPCVELSKELSKSFNKKHRLTNRTLASHYPFFNVSFGNGIFNGNGNNQINQS